MRVVVLKAEGAGACGLGAGAGLATGVFTVLTPPVDLVVATGVVGAGGDAGLAVVALGAGAAGVSFGAEAEVVVDVVGDETTTIGVVV